MAEPYYRDADVTLHLGDCLDVLAAMEDASVDAVVTDPPYGLEFMGREWDTFKPSAARIRERVDGRTNPAEGKSVTVTPEAYVAGLPFQRWCEAWAAECLRVLKPGGHLLAFGGTRTWHRLVCGIEDAGFEVRDAVADLTGYDAPGLMWVYGSGFPKSLDVSKAIDKRAEENVETKRRIAAVAEVIRTHREAKGMTPQQVSLAVVGTPSGACWNWEHHQLPSVEMWPAIKAALGIADEYDALIEGDRTQFIAAEREVIGHRADGAGNGSVIGLGSGRSMETEFAVTASGTEDAARWEGWGTALKPGWEPICVARKPLGGTVAGNVLEYGTGALNIDGCRVEGVPPSVPQWQSAGSNNNWAADGRNGAMSEPSAAGRWPPNVVLGPAAAAELDRQSGTRPLGGITRRKVASSADRDGNRSAALGGESRALGDAFEGYSDTGGASRFFPVFRYSAKAPTSERPVTWQSDCDCETVKPCPSQPRDTTGSGSADDGRSWSTSGSGSGPTAAPSRQDTTSTTGTATSSTTIPQTSSSSPSWSTSESTPGASYGTGSGGSPAAYAGNSSPSTLSTGTSPPRDGRFTDDAAHATSERSSSPRNCGVCGKPWKPERHPTVKPVDLMRWLVRLVTPPGGLVLDPFAGSGTTAEACIVEGFRCVLAEKDPASAELIVRRLRKPIQPVMFGDVS